MIGIRKPVINLDSRLRDIPKDWLMYFEPYIYRCSDHSCWLWLRQMIGGLPVMRCPSTGRKNVSAPRVMMRLFFDFDDTYYVRRVKSKCPRKNCMNPNHYIVSDLHPNQKGEVDESDSGATEAWFC